MRVRVKVGKFIVVVKSPTMQDDINREILSEKLQEDIPLNTVGIWGTFAEACCCVESYEDIPFDPTTLYAVDKQTAKAAYQQFLAMDKRVGKKWLEAVRQVNKDYDDTIGPEPLSDSADPKE